MAALPPGRGVILPERDGFQGVLEPDVFCERGVRKTFTAERGEKALRTRRFLGVRVFLKSQFKKVGRGPPRITAEKP
jgi:hypothetical protein